MLNLDALVLTKMDLILAETDPIPARTDLILTMDNTSQVVRMILR